MPSIFPKGNGPARNDATPAMSGKAENISCAPGAWPRFMDLYNS